MFLTPTWNPKDGHYMIEVANDYTNNRLNYLLISRDRLRNTVFTSNDALHNTTDAIVNTLIKEGAENKWFAKLPSHEQLMKRIQHRFTNLATDSDTMAYLSSVLMTPKLLTFVWKPVAVALPKPEEKMESSVQPPLYFEDSDSDVGTEPELQESALPPVSLRDTEQESHEQYLLTRLRAAKARVETERLRIQYFETTGRMPPDSDEEDEDEEDN
jgi:hypothetical protein